MIATIATTVTQITLELGWLVVAIGVLIWVGRNAWSSYNDPHPYYMSDEWRKERRLW